MVSFPFRHLMKSDLAQEAEEQEGKLQKGRVKSLKILWALSDIYQAVAFLGYQQSLILINFLDFRISLDKRLYNYNESSETV